MILDVLFIERLNKLARGLRDVEHTARVLGNGWLLLEQVVVIFGRLLLDRSVECMDFSRVLLLAVFVDDVL